MNSPSSGWAKMTSALAKPMPRSVPDGWDVDPGDGPGAGRTTISRFLVDRPELPHRAEGLPGRLRPLRRHDHVARTGAMLGPVLLDQLDRTLDEHRHLVVRRLHRTDL